MIVAEVVLVVFFLGQYSHVWTKLLVGHMLAAAIVFNLSQKQVYQHTEGFLLLDWYTI